MGSAEKTPSLSPLLDNDLIARIERLRLNARRRFTNRSQGEHLAGRGGTSTEFSDYRDYSPGDDIRFVDWNIFSRLHRPYVKLFRLEEEMHVAILIDASSSMLFEDKLLRARQLAAAFGIMGLMNLERVSVYVSGAADKRPIRMPSCTGQVSMRRMLDFLDQFASGGDCTIDRAIEEMLRLHRGRGVVMVLSDFLTFGDLGRSLNRLFSAGLEIFAVQILSPSEIDPDVSGDFRLIDAETGNGLDVSSATDLLGIYQEQRSRFQASLAADCRRRSGRFLSISSHQLLERVIFDQLRRQGWVI